MTIKFNVTNVKQLLSKEDSSANYYINTEDDGKIEARFVNRPNKDHISIYVSSATGCNQSCRFCHLTQTKQTMQRYVFLSEIVQQVAICLHHNKKYNKINPKTKVNINFMSRGEPLLNPNIIKYYPILGDAFNSIFKDIGSTYVSNISTIMPLKFLEGNLVSIFGKYPVNIYYSLYSMNPAFRKKWIPKAMSPYTALDKLKYYQENTDNKVVFHWAFIKNENDDYKSIIKICKEIKKRQIRAKFNIVAYNPFDDKSFESSKETIEQNINIIKQYFGENSCQTLARVGYDVKASCGMFLN